MKAKRIKYLPLLLCMLMFACISPKIKPTKNIEINKSQSGLKNEKLRNYQFLQIMYSDSYFPNFLVDKGKDILIELCFQIENNKPKTLPELYELTHAATNKFNILGNEFFRYGSEIETAARESIAGDFLFIAQAYGYDADIEEMIATRFW